MTDFQTQEQQTELNKSRIIGAALDLSAIAVFVASVVWGIALIMGVWNPPDGAIVSGQLMATIKTIVFMIVGIAAGVALWGLGEVVRRLDVISQNAKKTPQSNVETPQGTAAVTGSTSNQGSTQVIDLLRDIRDLTLLDEQQRARRQEIQGTQLVKQLEQEVPHLLREHNWVDAHRKLREARTRFPAFSQWDALAEQVELARRKIEKQDVETAKRQVEDLITLGAWDRAIDVVRDLWRHHPESPEAETLAKNVAGRRDKAIAQERIRLLAQAQSATDSKDWHAALHLAQTLIARFPKSPEAEALREQLPTLRDNAEIQKRKQLESRIRDLIQDHAFVEALAIAKTVITEYPDSPQAEILRDQLPRLEQRAQEQQQTQV